MFPGAGVVELLAGGGQKTVTPYIPTQMVVDAAGNVFGVFPGAGVVELFAGGGQKTVTPFFPTLLAVDAADDVFGVFPGAGVVEFLAGGGQKTVTPFFPTQLAVDAAGDVFGQFPGAGVVELFAGGGQTDADIDQRRADRERHLRRRVRGFARPRLLPFPVQQRPPAVAGDGRRRVPPRLRGRSALFGFEFSWRAYPLLPRGGAFAGRGAGKPRPYRWRRGGVSPPHKVQHRPTAATDLHPVSICP